MATEGTQHQVCVEGITCAEVSRKDECLLLLAATGCVFCQKSVGRARNVKCFMKRAVYDVRHPTAVPARVGQLLKEVAAVIHAK